VTNLEAAQHIKIRQTPTCQMYPSSSLSLSKFLS